MYLYDGNKKEIKVYGFGPKMFGRYLSMYKKGEMEKIEGSRRILKAVTNVKDFPLHRENLVSEMDYSKINYVNKKIFNKTFHKIESYKHTFDYGYYSTFDSYCDGAFLNSPLISVLNNGIIENWIITQGAYTQVGDIYEMEGIINIPYSLKVLRELEVGNFTNLTNDQIKEYARLFVFTKEPIAVYDKSLIYDLYNKDVVDVKITDDILDRDSETIKRLSKIYK